jgi:NDP-sugar pyrophosphorylase family protein
MMFRVEDDPSRARRALEEVAPTLGRPAEELGERLLVASAEACADRLSRFAEAGVQRMFLWPVGDPIQQLTRPDAPFRFYHPNRPIFTHARYLTGSLVTDCSLRQSIVAEGCYLGRATIDQSIVGIRSVIQDGATITRSVLLGADYYGEEREAPARGDKPRMGIGRDVVLDRVIVDKNARVGDGCRLVNEAGDSLTFVTQTTTPKEPVVAAATTAP